MIELTIYSNGKPRAIRVPGHSLTIGRGKDCDFRIDSLTISRRHAVLTEADGELVLAELETANPLQVNGRCPAQFPLALSPEDTIHIGGVLLFARLVKTDTDPVAAPRRTPIWPRVAGVAVGTALCLILFGFFHIQPSAKATSAIPVRVPSAEPVQVVPPVVPLPTDNLPQPAGTTEFNLLAPPATMIPAAKTAMYQSMTEDQKREFVRRQAQRIARMIGNRDCAFEPAVVSRIKSDVDSYLRRKGNGSERLWGEDLERLLQRVGTRYAGEIIRSFHEEKVPPVIGLYLAMIETEYHECLTSPVGAQGMFQFMPDTARGYGLDPQERCDWKKAARAAARYMKARMNQFGTDATSVSLAIAGYNRGPGSVMRDLETVQDATHRERSFWALVAQSERLDHYFQQENIRYVPKFFAAAIIGETPWAFGLSAQPLSTCQ